MNMVQPATEESTGEGNASPHDPSLALNPLYGLLSNAYSMIHGMLERIRESQGVLQDTAVRKLHDTNAKLHEVTCATESAATDIMDGIDRALALLDRLEAGEASQAVAPEIRDELFGVMNHLQFQDIMAQQLQYASALLHEMESQLVEFARSFDPAAHGAPAPAPAPETARPSTFDPGATFGDAVQRQALADRLLGQ